MDFAVVILIQLLYAAASLALVGVGLAVIYAMMRVINLAHGEFLMLGGYATIVANGLGVDLFLAMLVVAPVVVGLIGLVVERLVIRFLYGRMLDTMLASWGLSLLLIGLVSTLFGNTTRGLSAPLGSVAIGDYRESLYTLFVIGLTGVVMLALFLGLKLTRLGLIARGTMDDPAMAAALGINPDRVYAATFALGAALSGLAGAVLAPVAGVVPTMGVAYIAKAFITVISAGASVVPGLAGAAGLLGAVNGLANLVATPVIGEVALLAAAILLLRLLPEGLAGRWRWLKP